MYRHGLRLVLGRRNEFVLITESDDVNGNFCYYQKRSPNNLISFGVMIAASSEILTFFKTIPNDLSLYKAQTVPVRVRSLESRYTNILKIK